MPPLRGGISGRFYQDLPSTRLQGGSPVSIWFGYFFAPKLTAVYHTSKMKTKDNFVDASEAELGVLIGKGF